MSAKVEANWSPNVCLLGFTVTDRSVGEIVRKGDVLPTQTHAFAWNIVRSLSAVGCQVNLLSAWPVTEYPRYPQVAFPYRRIRTKYADGVELPFVNLLLLKHVTRLISTLTFGLRMFMRWRPDVLLIHGVHAPFLVAGVLCARFRRARVVVFVTDAAGVVREGDSRLTRLMKQVDRRLVKFLLARVDGVVALTSSLASSLAPTRPVFVMDGFAERSEVTRRSAERERPLIMYAGGLNEEYGVRTLVEAIISANTDCELAIYGKGPLSGWIEQMSLENSRVRRPVVLTRPQVLDAYGDADVLVQPRPLAQDLVSMSFPSKLLEYISSGTPVLSTRIPGISDEMDDMLYWVKGDGVDDMSRAIDNCLQDSAGARLATAECAREHILETRGPAARGNQLLEFLAGL